MRTEGSFSAWYFEHRLPIRPSRYAEILRTVVTAANAETEGTGRVLIDIAASYSRPDSPDRDEAPALKSALAALPGAADVIERGLVAYRPQENDPARVAMLHRLLERQYYRLAHWRVAVSEINYRRFFDVSDLAGIRVENWRTFRDTHHLVAALITEGRLHGLRLDHIDGLYDPIQYTRRLQRLRAAQPQAAGRAGRSTFSLRRSWPMASPFLRSPASPNDTGLRSPQRHHA